MKDVYSILLCLVIFTTCSGQTAPKFDSSILKPVLESPSAMRWLQMVRYMKIDRSLDTSREIQPFVIFDSIGLIPSFQSVTFGGRTFKVAHMHEPDDHNCFTAYLYIHEKSIKKKSFELILGDESCFWVIAKFTKENKIYLLKSISHHYNDLLLRSQLRNLGTI